MRRKIMEKICFQRKENLKNVKDLLSALEKSLDDAWENEEKMDKLYEKCMIIEWSGIRF